MINLSKLEEMNPEVFTYSNYDGCWWTALDLSYALSLNQAHVMKLIEKFAVGYCDAARLKVMPKTGTYAIMLSKDNCRFWFHLDKNWFDIK